jgi:molybdopterin-dependent oxidoreductase alpha subunit
MARRSGGFFKLYRALRTRNTCKTCALGMGGQRGGMVDELGRFPEVCKKSMQAVVADMQGRVPADFFEHCGFDRLQTLTPRQLEALGRLTEPLYAGPHDARYRAIGWDEALEHCARRLKSTQPDENFFYCSGRSSNEAGFLLQLFARLYGTNQVNNCSYYCHQASGVGLSDTLGTGTATVTLEDVDSCDLFVLLGGNPASNHPRLMRQLVRLRRRGGHVVVINPLREVGLVRFRVPSDVRSLLLGSSIASLYVQPHIGGDIALLMGVAKHVLELAAEDRAFLDSCTSGWKELQADLQARSWPDLEHGSGVPRETIEQVAALYARSQRTIFAWTMGITHHAHGVENVHAIVNLALLRGMAGKAGAGLLPIRGHSNVQGIGSVGVTPKLKDAVLQHMERHFAMQLPASPGLDTLSCIEAMHSGHLRNAWAVGGNLFGATPDAGTAAAAFGRLESIVYLSTTLNTGHARGRAAHTLILPVLPRDEEPQKTTQESMFNYVRLSDGGAARHAGPRSEVAIIADLADRVVGSGGPVDWAALREHRNIRRAIAAIVPGYEQIGQIDDTGREFQIGGRTLHTPHFATADGRAHLLPTPIPPRQATDGQLLLMTIRSEGQFNTVVYEDEDVYRGQERRDVILLSAEDIRRLGLHPDQCVTVRSSAGEMSDIRVREFPIRPGNAAMYFPEANVLVPMIADPRSRTPAFKSVAVTLHPAAARVPLPVMHR